MYYKSDWDQAKRRIEAFWSNEIIDRCCLAVYAPRKNSKLPPFPELQYGPWLGGLEKFSDYDQESITKWWVDPEENYKRAITFFENTFFGGEAIPATYINWGASAMAAFFGSEPIFKKNTVWYPSVIDNWETWKWNFNQKINKHWNQILEISKFLIEQDDEMYFVGNPELGAAGDVLSLMRGMDNLAIDLIEHPLEIKNAINILSDTWISLHEQIFQLTKGINSNGGVLAWLGLWAPGRHDQLACDFSSILSQKMFKDFFVEEIKKEGDWCEYATYHLDGPDALNNHLDILLEIEQIDNIEWTPGIGCPPTLTPNYISIYKKIQSSGKRIYLLAKPEEIEPLLSELSPKGLFINTYVNSEDEANILIKKVERLSIR